MKRKNVLIVSMLTLTVLASSSAMAFADTNDTTSATAAKGTASKCDMRAELNLTDAQKTLLHESRASDLKEALANLVSAGTFTQAEADAMISNMPAAHADRDAGPFQNLTEKQKTALTSELETLRASSLKQLVSDGSITQAQADLLLEHGSGKMGEPRKGDGPRS